MGFPQLGLVVSMCFVLGIVLPAEFRVVPAPQNVQVAVRSVEAVAKRHDEYQQQHNLESKSTPSLDTGKPPSLQIAWLMSFPNSGTSYTSKLIRHISKTRTAGNYGNEDKADKGLSLPVFHGQPEGPFWQAANIHLEYTLPETFVLSTCIIQWSVSTTTTNEYKELIVWTFCRYIHSYVLIPVCSLSILFSIILSQDALRRSLFHVSASQGKGLQLGVDEARDYTLFLISPFVYLLQYVESASSFRRNCLSGKGVVSVNGTEVSQLFTYGPEKVVKAVHLVRDPFDNVVSRFNYVNRHGTNAHEHPKTREGFRDLCFKANQIYDKVHSESHLHDNELLLLMKDVPCYADFFRYVEWHNMAFVTSNDLNLDTYVLHYDWYDTRFNETADELLDFLHLEALAEPEPFVSGKVYRDYYTAEEQAAVKQVLESVDLKETWQNIAQYFHD
jgi:hypothetical protein